MAGSTRMIAPSRVTGSPGVRRSWLRSAPPSAVGGVNARHASRGVAAGIERRPVLPVIDEVEAGAVARAGVQGAVGPELNRAGGVARVLLTPVLDEHLLRSGHRVSRRLQPGQPPADDTAVRGRPGGVGHGSE